MDRRFTSLLIVSLLRMTRLGLVCLFLFCFATSAVFGQAPTVHASNLATSNVYCHYFTLAWTNGNGSNRIVVAREGSAVNITPTNYLAYNAKDTFGADSQIGTGNFVVYNGGGSSFTLKGLKKNTTYHLAIFEYNINLGNYEYYTESSFAQISRKTENIISDFSISKTYQCLANNYFQYTNKSSNSMSASMTYKWDFGDKTSSGVTHPDHVYKDGAIFKVVLTVSSTGCLTSTTIQDTVGVPFITYFELDKTISGNDSVQCFGKNQFNLLNKFKVPPPIYGTWDRTKNQWSTSDGQKGTAADFDFIAKTYGTITVKLIQSRQVSKGGEYCVDSFQRDFYVLPPPLQAKDVKFSDTLLCLSEGMFTFSHTASNIVSNIWNFGDGQTSTTNPTSHAYANVGKYKVRVDVVDNYGCIGFFEDSVEVVTTPNNFFTGLKPIYCINEGVTKLKPNIHGGQFKGGNVNAVDSTFTPRSIGSFTVDYIYQVGNCIDTFSASTEVKDRPVFNLGNDTVICPGTTIDLDVGIGGLNYTWSNGSTSQIVSVDKSGIFWAKANNGFCAGADTISIKGVFPPKLELGSDTIICGGQKVSVIIKTDVGTVLWSDGSTALKRDLIESGYYQVTLTHPCVVLSDDVTVEILPYACEMFVPNIFSPNGDQHNEVFKPVGFFEFTDMEIFNEYGERLFYTMDETIGWDGSYLGVDCQQGMYYYVIRYALPGEGSYEKKIAKGSIYVIR